MAVVANEMGFVTTVTVDHSSSCRSAEAQLTQIQKFGRTPEGRATVRGQSGPVGGPNDVELFFLLVEGYPGMRRAGLIFFIPSGFAQLFMSSFPAGQDCASNGRERERERPLLRQAARRDSLKDAGRIARANAHRLSRKQTRAGPPRGATRTGGSTSGKQ